MKDLLKKLDSFSKKSIKLVLTLLMVFSVMLPGTTKEVKAEGITFSTSLDGHQAFKNKEELKQALEGMAITFSGVNNYWKGDYLSATITVKIGFDTCAQWNYNGATTLEIQGNNKLILKGWNFDGPDYDPYKTSFPNNSQGNITFNVYFDSSIRFNDLSVNINDILSEGDYVWASYDNRVHTHEQKYEYNSDYYKVYCNNSILADDCPYYGESNAIVLTLNVSNRTYNGSPVTASFDEEKYAKWGELVGLSPSITYEYKETIDGEYKSTTDTTNAGYYKVIGKLPAVVGMFKEFQIYKADQTIASPTADSANVAATCILLNDNVAGHGLTKYAKSLTSTAPSNEDDWQESTSFAGLSKNTDYYFFAKYVGDVNYKEVVSQGTMVRTANYTETWNYSFDGNVLTATCNKECGQQNPHKATLTLTATQSNYPGEAPTIQYGTTDEQSKWNAAGALAYNTGTFKYFKSTGEGSTTRANNNEIDASAISAGNYVAEYTISGVTVKIPVKVLFNTHSTGNCTKFAGFTYILNDWYCYNTDSGLNHKVFVGDKLNKTSIAMEQGSEVWVDRDKAIYYKTTVTDGEIVAIDGSKIYICTNHVPGEEYCNSCGRNYEGSLMDKAYFIELINNATAGSTIKLEKDYVIDYPVVIDKELTLDLNGHKIESTKALTAMFAIRENGKLTVTDTSTAQTGKLKYTANSNYANTILYVDGGELIVNKGIFEVIGTDQQTTQTVSVLAGTATINDGSFTAFGKNNSSVTACTKNYADKVSVLTINGGTFNGTDSIKPFCSYKNTNEGDFGTVNINGGTLIGTLSTDSGKNISYVHIKGGTFTQDWSKKGTNEGKPVKEPLKNIIDSNCTLIANGNNTFSVHSWSYEANGATITATCDMKCGQTNAHTVSITLSANNGVYSGNAYAGASHNNGTTTGKVNFTGITGSSISNIKYVGNGDTAYNESETAPTAAGTYTAKVTITSGSNSYTAIKDFEITKASVDAPTSLEDLVIRDYVNETITLAVGYEISTTDGENFVAITQTDHKITLTPGTTYYVRKAADTNHKASGTIACPTVARSAAPTTLSYSKTDTTITVNAVEGNEYSIDNGTTWTIGTTVDNKLVVKFESLTADKDYTILSRVKATTTTAHSENLSTTVKTKKTTPTNAASLFKVTVPSTDGLIYSVSSKVATVTNNDGITGLGTITVTYYQKNGDTLTKLTSAPTDVGTYVVKASAKAGDNYNAIPEVEVGEFTITPATLTDVSVNQKANTEPTYTGSELSLQVETSATSVNNQTVKFVYSLVQEGTYTETVPEVTDAGEHTIYYKASANNHEETVDSFTVKVKPKVATSADILIPNTTLVGDGLTQVEIKAEDLLVNIANKTLVLDTDYELSGNKASSIGKHTLTIKFIGNYSGTITKEWMINQEVQTPVNVDLTKEEVEYKGNLTVTVTGDKDAPLITVNTPLDVLTDNDKTALRSSNTDIDIILTLKNKTADNLTKGSKDAIKGKGINLDNLTFLDITLDKVIRTKDSNGNVNTVTESLELTSKEIEITIDVPKSIANAPSGYNRTYSIIRSHKNADNTYTVDTLTTTYSNGTLTFKTDKFSDYAVTYVDTLIPVQVRPAYTAPRTDVAGSASLISSNGFIELGALAIGSMIGLISNRKKKEDK